MRKKIIEVYTQTQIQNLCEALKNAFKEICDMEKINTNINSPAYQVIADAINDVTKGVNVTPSWICSLFTEYIKKPLSEINSLMVDSVCFYLKGITSKEYFEKLSRNVFNIYGTYNVYWRGTTDYYENGKIDVGFQLKITQTEIFFIPKQEKEILYLGKAFTLLVGNTYIELTHSNNIEKVYIVLHIGIESTDLD